MTRFHLWVRTMGKPYQPLKTYIENTSVFITHSPDPRLEGAGPGAGSAEGSLKDRGQGPSPLVCPS